MKTTILAVCLLLALAGAGAAFDASSGWDDGYDDYDYYYDDDYGYGCCCAPAFALIAAGAFAVYGRK